MAWIFEIKDKSNRKIHLSKERWSHINQEHPEVSEYLQEMQETIENPVKIKIYKYDGNVRYYYRYYKSRESAAKYMLVIVKYLNGNGFIITAYFVRNIK